jgi:hypothetical protein
MRRLGTLVAAITLLTAAPASAATFTVTTTNDGGVCMGTSCPSIRAAIVAATQTTEADTIVVPAGNHQLVNQGTSGGQLDVDTSVTITGAGARSTTVAGSGSGPVFSIGSATVTIAGLTVSGGDGFQTGGNLANSGGTVLLDHVRVTGGRSGQGGGIANTSGSMTIQSSLIDGNDLSDGDSSGDGGGILNIGQTGPATLTVRDSTVTGNIALQDGGGISSQSNQFAATATLERVTVARNRSSAGSGGLAFAGAGSFTVRNSIIDDNLTVPASTAAFESNCGTPSPSSGGGNVVGSAPVGAPQCAFAASGDVVGADALLGPLGNQGGQTDVLPLLAGSPAINRAGACTGADQRDLPRPQGGACDSGAFEVDQPPDTQLVAAPPTFTFSSSEPGVRFECRLDRPTRTGTPFACSSPASFPDLPPGSYTFVVRAIDGMGNADPTAAAAAFVVQTPQPKAGRTVVVNRVRGKVLVKIPGGRFVDLSRITEIPDGSIIDTRKGVVVLVFRPRPGAKTQRAKFYDGLFKADQRGRIMELVLVEKLAKCQQQGDASAAARRKKRRLWGDGRGRFRTRGQYSSATVRGTKWLTQDSCAGTRTSVRRGKVDVRDFVRKKTIRLKKGQAYLARPNP